MVHSFVAHVRYTFRDTAKNKTETIKDQLVAEGIAVVLLLLSHHQRNAFTMDQHHPATNSCL